MDVTRLILVGVVAAVASLSAQVFPIPPLVSHVIVDSCSGCGGGSTIGAAVPATATPIGVKDNAGNLAYPLVDASGNLLVAVTGAGSGGTSSVDGSGYTAGTTAGTAVIGARDDTAPGTVAEDKLGIARITTYRGLHVNVRDAAGAELGVSAAPFYVTGGPERTTGAAYANKVWMAGAVQHDNQVTTGLADNSAGMLTIDNNGALWINDPFTVSYLPQIWGDTTSIRGSLPTSIGQKTMALSLGVVIASNQSAVPISGSLTANQSVNVAQVAGTNTVTGGVSGLLAVGGNVANAVAATANPVPVGGVFTTTPATLTTGQTATAQFTAAQNLKHDLTTVAGTAADTNSGTKSAGTLRVVLATDQPALTNKLLVTPDSVALPANQSVNVAQIGGTNTVTGGVAGILAVGGNVANAVAATANPVPVGGIFTTTPTTLTTGQTATAQYTAAQNLKTDLTTIAGTAPTTAGKVDVKAADGDVFVRQATAANLNATVTQLTLTKGTQGATGVSTQDLKDAGRTALSFYANAVAAGTTGTETIFTLTKASGTAATTTGTSFTVTNGKRFRITSLTFGSRGHLTATAQITTTSLRVNTAGACIVTSTPIELSAATATPATVQAWDRWSAPLPDGYEILGDGTLTFCVTANAVYTTNAPTWFVNLVGFEY